MENIFLYVALFASGLFVFQMVITFCFGDFDLDGDTDIGTDTDGHGGDHDHDSNAILKLFTIRNLVAFFLGFGWVGYGCMIQDMAAGWSIVLASITGLVFMGTVMMVMRSLETFEYDSTMRLNNAIGKQAQVYIAIKDEKAGKVMIILSGALVEIEAISNDADDLLVGEFVSVVAVNNNVLTVTKLKET